MTNPFTGNRQLTEPERQAIQMLKKILEMGLDGIGPLSGAKELGDQYINNSSPKGKSEKIARLIKWEQSKNFTSGFLSSLGGIITLPVAVPASLSANWILQTRMVAAMAHIGGFDIDEPPVKVCIALCLLGHKGKDALGENIYEFQNALRENSFKTITKQSVLILNQMIAMRLMQTAAKKGLSRISKAIPVLGGVVGGALDLYSCHETAKFAKELFQLDMNKDITLDE